VPRAAFVSIAVQRENGSFGTDYALYSVVWCRPADGGYEVGAELVDGPNLWNITFPEFALGGW
jgi:hypothetical protein